MSAIMSDLLTTQQLAAALNVGAQTVRDWHKAGVIPAEIAEGHVFRFNLENVREALAKRAKKGARK